MHGRTRIKLAVYVDLDPVPGSFHSAESAQAVIHNLLHCHIVDDPDIYGQFKVEEI